MNNNWIDELALNKKICFEYMRILSGLSKTELAERLKIETKQVYRMLSQTYDEVTIISNYKLFYEIFEKQIKMNNSYFGNYFIKNNFFNVYKDDEARRNFGLYFLVEGYEFICDEIQKNSFNKRILPNKFKERLKGEYERLNSLFDNSSIDSLNSELDKTLENLKVTSLFLLSNYMEFFINLTGIEWYFVERYNSHQLKIDNYMQMLIDLNLQSINFSLSPEEVKIKFDIMNEMLGNFEEFVKRYQKEINHDFKRKKMEKEDKIFFINKIKNDFQDILTHYNNQSEYFYMISFFITQSDLLNVITEDTLGALLRFKIMQLYASNVSTADQQAQLIIDLLK